MAKETYTDAPTGKVIQRDSDGVFIPDDLANVEYQQYLTDTVQDDLA